MVIAPESVNGSLIMLSVRLWLWKYLLWLQQQSLRGHGNLTCHDKVRIPGASISVYVKYVCIPVACLKMMDYQCWASVVLPVRGLQDTPASSECRQLCSPQALFGHCSRVSSLPVQRTSSSHTRLEPLPKCAWPHAFATPLQRKEAVQKNRRLGLQ